MKTMPKYKKSSLILQEKREEMLVDAASKANLMLTICVLADCFDFEEEQMNKFVDDYKTLADSCERGADDWRKISDEIFDRFGIKIV